VTCYLTTTPIRTTSSVVLGTACSLGVKLYPANCHDNSAAGVTDYRKVMHVLERMEKIACRS